MADAQKNGKPRNAAGYTETEQKMLAILSDGFRHRPHQLFDCLWDEEGRLENIQMHISNIRNRLRPQGQDIVCELANGVTWYRWVRLIGSPNK